jgi:hypothetical protein
MRVSYLFTVVPEVTPEVTLSHIPKHARLTIEEFDELL